MRAFLSAVLTIQLLAPPLLAADPVPLSLPQLLAEVQRVNPELAAARKRWEAAQAKIPLAKGLPAPRIGIEFEEIPRGSLKVDQATLMYQFIQSLPFPGKRSLRQEVAVKEAQMAAMAFKEVQWKVATMLKSVYYDLFLIDRQLEIGQERVMWLAQASAVAVAKYATGLSQQSELLRSQGEEWEARNSLAVLAHQRKALEAHLNHLLNRRSDAGVGNPAEIHLAPVPDSVEKLVADAQENQPELLMFKFSAERADAAWRLSKRELLPDLETMVELRDPAMGPIGPWDLTLALVLPFWFWTKQRYGVKVALHDKESAQAAYQAMRNELTRRIHESWHQAQAAYTTAELCEERLIPLAQRAVSSALAAYQGGQGSFMELLDALKALSQRRQTYDEHLVLLEQQRVLLEQSVGVPFGPLHQEEGGS